MGGLNAYFHAFGDLAHPETRWVVWVSLAFTMVSFAGLFVAVQFCLSAAQVTESSWIQFVFSWVVGILGGFGTLILVWVLFPVVATFFRGLLFEGFAKTLEFSHYPNDPPG